MKSYAIDYQYNGKSFTAVVDAKDKNSAKSKIGRKHKLNAEQAKKSIKLTKVSVIGYF